MARVGCAPNGAGALLPVADADLPYIQRAKAGDTEAFGPLWAKYERALYQFFLKETASRQDAEDLASETLIAALQSLSRFRGTTRGTDGSIAEQNCTFKTYLLAVARYQLARWIRRKRVRNEVRAEDLLALPGASESDLPRALPTVDPYSNPLESVLEAERRDEVDYALASMGSSAQFQVVLLHYLAGLTHQDIATVLTTRSETVNNRLQDGRKAFRRQIRYLDGAGTEA